MIYSAPTTLAAVSLAGALVGAASLIGLGVAIADTSKSPDASTERATIERAPTGSTADAGTSSSSSRATGAATANTATFDAASAFLEVLSRGALEGSTTIDDIDANWTPDMTSMLIETLRFGWSSPTRPLLLDLLRRKTGMDHGGDIDQWWRDTWSKPEQRHPTYADFKSRLYRNIDPVFAGYFETSRATDIRLDEARWGGVRQDGIPPLRYPKMLAATEADYLDEDDVVFGIDIDGDARAYPKRILAWHEMFIDTIGGVEIAGVYCTLCGAVIPYETSHAGVRHELGTSGFLYRSNKLMYDRATQSLWSTTRGEPVVGPLVGQGISLARRAVVTTTWGEWRRRHADTTVLDIDTGHRRDYGEGVAYRDYFATDELMFTVPELDKRLANKAEILALQTTGTEAEPETVAIHAEFLQAKPLHIDTLGGREIVVLTDTSGANRVYPTGGVEFKNYDGDSALVDTNGDSWTLGEAALTHEDGRQLERLPAHRAFWFGWVAVHGDTRLVL